MKTNTPTQTSCEVTYFDWVCENNTTEAAGNLIYRSNGDMRCTLEAGHSTPHKWEPIVKRGLPAWSKPQEFR